MTFLNEATWDRAVRVVLGLAMLYAGWGGLVEGTFGTVLKFLGFVPLLTGFVGWCPLYTVLRFKTN